MGEEKDEIGLTAALSNPEKYTNSIDAGLRWDRARDGLHCEHNRDRLHISSEHRQHVKIVQARLS